MSDSCTSQPYTHLLSYWSVVESKRHAFVQDTNCVNIKLVNMQTHDMYHIISSSKTA